MTELIADIGKFALLESHATNFERLGNQYLLCRVKGNIELLFPNETGQKLFGILIFRLRTGQIELEANMERYRLVAGDLLILNPGAKITQGRTLSKSAEWDILFASVEFLKDLNMDFNALNIPSLTTISLPRLHLTPEESENVLPYFNILASNTKGGTTPIRLKIARSLFTALIYQLLEMFFCRLENQGDQAGDSPGQKQHKRRPSNYVRDFIRLLHLNYMTERSAEFYASRLCITPKYLSIILKEATGRSVNSWINEFVLIEAKNMLRFSGKSIQQVAYALNFPSQSSFGKYFKRLTGISPTEYQKTD